MELSLSLPVSLINMLVLIGSLAIQNSQSEPTIEVKLSSFFIRDDNLAVMFYHSKIHPRFKGFNIISHYLRYTR